jgi:hypothetical protein
VHFSFLIGAVTTAGRPSGTAASAGATPKMSTSESAENREPLRRDAGYDHHGGDDDDDDAEQQSSSCCSGVVSGGASFRIPAMRPIALCIPVATTNALLCP